MPSSSNGDQIKESDRMSTQLPIPKTSIRNGSAKYGTTNEIRRACETRNRLLMLPELQQELDRIRRQYQTMEMETAALITLYTNLRMRNEELSREDTLRSKLNTPFSPIPAQNLQPAIMSVAQLDGTIVQPMIDTSLDSFDTRIKFLDTASTTM